MENINFMPVWTTVITVLLLLLWGGSWAWNKLKAHGVFDKEKEVPQDEAALKASIKQGLKALLGMICFVIAVCAGIYFYVFLVQTVLRAPLSYDNFITTTALIVTLIIALIFSVVAFMDSDMPENPLISLGIVWGAFITINLFINAFVVSFITGLIATGIMFAGFLSMGVANRLLPDK